MKTKSEISNLDMLETLNGKVKYTHKSVHDGRKQTVALVKIDEKYYQGNAQCSKKDVFSRKIGRAISLGRAMKNYQDGNHINMESISNDFRFKEDRVIR